MNDTLLDKTLALVELEQLRIKTENDIKKSPSVDERLILYALLKCTNETIDDLMKELKNES